ncbi:MAG: hypothetical protein AAF604_23240 [Acidobacteriota bacterium]
MEKQLRQRIAFGLAVTLLSTGASVGATYVMKEYRQLLPWPIILSSVSVLSAAVVLAWGFYPRWTSDGLVWEKRQNVKVRGPGSTPARYDMVIEVRAESAVMQPVNLRIRLEEPLKETEVLAFHESNGQTKIIGDGSFGHLWVRGKCVFVRYATPPLREGEALKVYIPEGRLPIQVARRD